MEYPNDLITDSTGMVADTTIMPVQFHLRNTDSPLKRLFMAVLEDAIRVISNSTDKRLISEAKEWVAEDNHHIFGVTNTCEVLGIAPELLRARILSGVPLELKRRSPSHKAPLTIS